MGKPIYVIHYADAWKSYSSMRIAGVTSSIRKVKSLLEEFIRNEDIDYGNCPSGENASSAEQVRCFLSDWKEHGPEFVFNNLNYGCVTEYEDGRAY